MPTSPLPPMTDRWGDRLPRRLGFWSAVAVLVGSTIGGGIFRTPAVIAGRVPEPVLMLLVWVLGGLLALCGALTYAELAAMFPRSGGVYVYVREGFGRLPAFLFGWSELLLIRASALGAIATPFAEYLLRSLGLDPTRPPYDGAVHWVAALAIVLTATLNYVGVGWRAGGDPRDGGDLQHAAGLDAHRATHFLRDGGRRAVLPACGPRAPDIPHSFGGDRPDGGAGDRVRRVPDVPAARRSVRGRDLPVLRARGGGGVRTAAAPAAGRGAACGAGTRLSRGAGAVRAGDAVHARQRAVAGPAPHRARVPDHSRRRARVPGVAAPVTRGLGVTRT